MPTLTAPTTREQRARHMGRRGYTLSESICTVGVYFVGKRGQAEPYVVDIAAGTCTCEDFARHGAPCKHQMFVALCCRWWMKLEQMAAQSVRSRRRFSKKHLAAFRALAPTMAAPVPVDHAGTPRRWNAAEYAQHLSEDF